MSDSEMSDSYGRAEKRRKTLPARGTRGKRMGAAMEEEDEADKEFWDQEFFQEEKLDEDYESEQERSESYEVDSDFWESEDDAAGEAEVGEEELRRRERKAKQKKGGPQLKKFKNLNRYKQEVAEEAAGSKKRKRDTDDESSKGTADTGEGESGQSRSTGKAASAASDGESESGSGSDDDDDDESAPKSNRYTKTGRIKGFRALQALGEVDWDRPSLRRTTMKKSVQAAEQREKREVEDRVLAEKRRVQMEKAKANYKPLTMNDVLADAAFTELENQASLQYLLMREEEQKKKAFVEKHKMQGPHLRRVSRIIDGNAQVWIEARNAKEGLHQVGLAASVAPPKPQKAKCAITGKPAKYRDPLSGQPYCDAKAFRELRKRWANRPKTPPPQEAGAADGEEAGAPAVPVPGGV
ncbi:unnamed protein product [Pedinophyceae sp. YPF-701]|nr:unnamed protein product [Pedinophyceae sp. YPF-701]